VTTRARALGAGIALATVYAASAVLSGHLSPLARRPLLDGLAPPTAYRWVEPPPELAATNKEPTPLSLQVGLKNKGSETAVPTTEDAQVSLILPQGAFADDEGQRSVEVTIQPVGPSTLSPPDAPLRVIGNAYRLGATYAPSGKEAPLQDLSTVVLVYPLLANDHGAHTVIWSRDGSAWGPLQTDDLPSIQQAGGDLTDLGYVAVAAQPASPTVGGPGSGGSSVATIAIVAGLVVLAVVAAFLLRRRR
jgi:MYXO-CTERM domain-containing protein